MFGIYMQNFFYRFTGICCPSDRVYNQYVDRLPKGGVEELEEFIAKTQPDSYQEYLNQLKKPLICRIISAQQFAKLYGKTKLEVGEIAGNRTPDKESIDHNVECQNISIEDRCKLTTGFANKLYDVLGNGTRQMDFIYETSCYDEEENVMSSYSIIGQPIE